MSVLDCGHEPSPHSEHTTGYGVLSDGRRLCWECCHALAVEELKADTDVWAYMSSDGHTITTWTGGHLARVTSHTKSKRYTPSGGFYVRHYITARDVHGADWHGTGEGPGMHCHLRRTKVKP